MSTRNGVLRQSHRVGLRVWLAAIVTLLVVIGGALAIELSSRIDTTGLAANEGIRGAHALKQTFSVPDYGIKEHAPNEAPRQFLAADYDIRPHGPNQMPKRESIRPICSDRL